MAESTLKGKKVLVMGLGLHGGGVETARFLVRRGARVVCTDLRGADRLKPSLDALKGLPVRYVLGRHDPADFDTADIIVKNPAVAPDNPLLARGGRVETDISLFLSCSPSPLIAVTGSKGKSTTASAVHHILRRAHPGARLGGNITVSPLNFLDDLRSCDPVILELSSWQLADLRFNRAFHPNIACITNLMWDHQNRYASFADYEADKAVVFGNLNAGGRAVFPDNPYGRKWAAECAGTAVLVGAEEPSDLGGPRAWLDSHGRGLYRPEIPAGAAVEAAVKPAPEGSAEELLPPRLRVPGLPFRLNALFAGTIARLWGCDDELIREALADFPGVPYRMECFLESGGIVFYDDTAATIPAAAAAAVRSLDRPVILIAGGTDKQLDFSDFDSAAPLPKRIVMLAGSATEKWLPRIRRSGGRVEGPVADMNAAVNAALAVAAPGDAVLLSPGAASFGMFNHEFERGDAFKAACRIKNQQ